jgi:hypothetical protein
MCRSLLAERDATNTDRRFNSERRSVLTIRLESIPITNTLELVAEFYFKKKYVDELSSGDAKVLTIQFDRITVGRHTPRDYKQKNPADVDIAPGNLAFIEPITADWKQIALRYGAPGTQERTIVFVHA